MSTAVLEAPISQLVPGDKVMILRNLDNPAWMTPVHGFPRDTNIQWQRRTDLTKEIGVGEVTAVRDRPSFRVQSNELVREIRREILVDRVWYDSETLVQVGPDSTYLEPLAQS